MPIPFIHRPALLPGRGHQPDHIDALVGNLHCLLFDLRGAIAMAENEDGMMGGLFLADDLAGRTAYPRAAGVDIWLALEKAAFGMFTESGSDGGADYVI